MSTRPPLFYCADLRAAAPELSADEARHISAQRLRVGDAVSLFDGRGISARARLAGFTERGRQVQLAIEQRREFPAPQIELALYCALPKGDRLHTLLDMGTQLGMTRFTPLLCERSVVQPGETWSARAERVCIEACKQSRRYWLPALQRPMSLHDALADANTRAPSLWFAHPGGRPMSAVDANGSAVAIFIGPEGGFTEEEAAAAQRASASVVDLGPRLLRIETAAVALLSLAGWR